MSASVLGRHASGEGRACCGASLTLANVWLVTVLLCVLPPATAFAQSCMSDTIGIDASLANNYSGAVLGQCPGETFLAADTLLEFLRVWRAGSETGKVICMAFFNT